MEGRQAESLQHVFNVVVARGLGRTAVLLRAVLRSALNRAVKLRRIDVNPVLGTEQPKYTPIETDTWSAEQAARFLSAVEGVRNGALFVSALSLGLRKGEASGLNTEDLDLDNRILRVRRTLCWIKTPGEEHGHWHECEPSRVPFGTSGSAKRSTALCWTTCQAAKGSGRQDMEGFRVPFRNPHRRASPRERPH